MRGAARATNSAKHPNHGGRNPRNFSRARCGRRFLCRPSPIGIVDLACGTGAMLRAIAPRLPMSQRAMIATRTRDALKRAKARGVKLGGPKLRQAREAAVKAIEINAERHAAKVLPIIREIQRAGAKSLRAIAKALNARCIATARGGRWQAQTVANALARAK